jgi:alkaline phosphatase/streptomycin-6-phosphatase
VPKRTVTILAGMLVAAAAVSVGLAAQQADRSDRVRQAIDKGRADNVILLIGDGMGDSEITIGRNYLVGAAGRLAMDELPLTGQMTTWSITPDGKPDYDPESASTSTAWSTGRKTVDGRISTSPTDADLTTILELAKKEGYRTGNVTTAELTDATPAGPMSHVTSRTCQGPLNMASCPADLKSSGGPGSIAEQAVQHGVDVLLGGGKARFDQLIPAGEGQYAGQTVLQQAAALGYSVVTDRPGLLAATPGKKLLGLFTPVNMSVEFTGPQAANPPVPSTTCTTGQRPAGEPSLADMTRKAIELLDARAQGRGSDRPGFFLQVESASIDKRDHAAEACQQIGETKNMDEAVRVALDFAKRHEDTLIIVTADHAHTSQIVETTASPPGASIVLRTHDGVDMMVTYGTAVLPASQEHTGSQLRVAAQGPQAANVVGLIDQTELFQIMKRALGA